MKLVLDILGWVGSFFVVISYALSQVKHKDYSTLCRYLNLCGGILVAFNCFYYSAIPSFVTNVIWTFIAIISISGNKGLWKRNNRFRSRRKPGFK
ncbi:MULTISPECIES: CBU_0592 family membrane protein [Mesonia]|uniref:Uncharacterized protein n=1 Tax=Mesonia oceanica TaxID=2687242 RepID=A0AC61YA36_9FLAO|nr:MULTISPECIES: hypothetical protein [Mesonia]VVV01367.1 hypothetical protein FVB9532_02657 [Mesonia oceanica]|tara:strand:- start:1417 stop:1701 length:285 start_codon:yes stop_codon:yes gene_type:complete